MLLHVPAAKTQIQPAREGDLMVDHDYLLMMCLRGSANRLRGSSCAGLSYPVEGHVGRVLEWRVVGMAHNHDIPVARRARRTQFLEGTLGVCAVARYGGSDLQALGRALRLGEGWKYLLVDNHVYLDASFRTPLEEAVEPPFLVEMRRAAEKLRAVSQQGVLGGWMRRLASSGDSHQSAI